MNEAPKDSRKNGQSNDGPREDSPLKDDQVEIFPVSPLISATLLSLYLALVLPMPLLAPESQRLLISLVLGFGLLGLVSMLSEQVRVSEAKLSVRYPFWCAWFLRKGWSSRWDELKALVPIRTSQGGNVFYLITKQLNNHLLPQRIDRFEHFLKLIQKHSGIDTSQALRLTPAWTYQLLFGLSLLMLAGEGLAAFSIWKGWLALPAGYSI